MFLSDEQKLSFLIKISNKLQEVHCISSYEYELFNLIKQDQNISYEINGIKKIGEENNANEEKIENRITKEKIKSFIEKIISYIKDKKDYEFISDFFITESTSIKDNDNNNIIINNKNNNFEFEDINDDFLKFFSKSHLTNINSIIEFNKKLKGNKFLENDDDYDSILNLNLKKYGTSPLKENLFLDDIKKSENFNKNRKKEENLKPKKTIDEEMEEEMCGLIFGFTKRMKQNAKHMGEQFRKNNKELSEIENIQNEGVDITDKTVKKLKSFNISMNFGFCKLLKMSIKAIIGFFGALAIIKIFPKLA